MQVLMHVESLESMREVHTYAVVQFGFWFNLDFPLFFFMLIYDNEYQTKENPNWTKNQIELQHIHTCTYIHAVSWMLSKLHSQVQHNSIYAQLRVIFKYMS